MLSSYLFFVLFSLLCSLDFLSFSLQTHPHQVHKLVRIIVNYLLTSNLHLL